MKRNVSLITTVQFAWKDLFSGYLRFFSLTCSLTIAFLLLVNVCAIFCGVLSHFSSLPEAAAAPIWVKHRLTPMFDIPTPINDSALSAIRTMPGVMSADPYYHCMSWVKRPDGVIWLARIIVVNDATLAGLPGLHLIGNASCLNEPNAIAIDTIEARQLGNPAIGDEFELNNCRLVLAAFVDIKPNTLAQPVIYMTESTFLSVMPSAEKTISFIMVWPQKNTSVKALCNIINQKHPDLTAMPQRDFLRLTAKWYLKNTVMPILFMIIVIIGLILSVTIVTQQLFAFVAQNMTLLATLKALGFSDGDLWLMSALETLFCCFFAYGTGTYILTMEGIFFFFHPRILFYIPPELLVGGIAILLLSCILACSFALRQLSKIDPMQVFRS